MMFKRFLKSNFFKRSVIIITLTAVFTAVFSIFIVGFSADSYRPVTFNLVSWADNINTSVQYSYSPNGSMQVSAFGPDSLTDYRMNSPYKVYGFFDTNSFYFPGATFFNASGIRKNIVFNLYFGFQYYFDSLSFDFYMLLPESGDRSFTISYLDSDNQFVYGNVTLSALRFDSLSGYFSHNTYSSYFSQAYKDYVNSASSYYTDVSGITHYHDNTSVKYYFFKCHVSFDNLNKTPINFLSFYLNFNTYSSSVAYPYIKPYFYFPDPNLDAYILQSDTETYTDILNSLDDVNDKLDDLNNTISGEMPSEASQQLDSQAQQQAQLQGDIKDVEDKISDFEEDIEWQRTYPEVDQDNVQSVYSSAVTTFFSFLYDPTELIPRLIAFGSSMLILFTVFKRF